MVSDNKGNLNSAPHTLIFPGLAIFFTVLGFVLVGDGLRDTLDPKMRK
jgi:peptide/nickel transport system permease protein